MKTQLLIVILLIFSLLSIISISMIGTLTNTSKTDTQQQIDIVTLGKVLTTISGICVSMIILMFLAINFIPRFHEFKGVLSQYRNTILTMLGLLVVIIIIGSILVGVENKQYLPTDTDVIILEKRKADYIRIASAFIGISMGGLAYFLSKGLAPPTTLLF